MTVAPQRPQDGNRQPNGSGNGVESDERFATSALPPTLFRLPDLTPVAPRRRVVSKEQLPLPVNPIAAAPAPQAVVATPSAVPQPTPPTLAASDAAATDSESEDSQISETSRASAAPQRGATAVDQPAGRTWMEAIGANRTVLAVLLLVIAAAVVTARRSNDLDGIEASLAENGDQLKFDASDLDLGADIAFPEEVNRSLAATDGASKKQANLSLPGQTAASPQGSATSAALASGAVAAPASKISPDALIAPVTSETVPATAGLATSGHSTLGPSGSVSSSTATSKSFDSTKPVEADAASTGAVGSATETIASLNQPLRESAGVSGGMANPVDAALAGGPDFAGGRVETNKFFTAVPGVEATPVSNRTVTPNAASLPTLEDLASQTTEVASQESTPASAHVLSGTPVGISDWSQYLPPERSAATPTTNLPLSSN